MGAVTAQAAAAPAGAVRAASLFDIDAELAERLDARQRTEARPHAIVPVIELTAGPWSPEHLDDGAARAFALMVTDGLVLRELLLVGSTATELLGPGDVVALGPSDDAFLPTKAEWSVPQAARIAVLDDRLAGIVHAWPGVSRLLLERAARREIRLSTHRAIAQLPRVDQRLVAFFAHLAERWGRVAANGVVVPIQLTHETLGRLIGARRPTVSLALKDLAADGLLRRREDGAWLLGYEAFERLGAESAVPVGWQRADARPLGEPRGDGAAASRQAARGMTPEDMAALRERVESLRSQYETRLIRAASTVERSREMRLTLRRERGLRTGW